MRQQGFTITELIIFLAVFSVILSLTTVNIIHFGQRSSLNATVTSFISDVKEQQTKAMASDTEGTGVIDSYGVYFETSDYILFKGSSYTAGNSHNFAISLPTNDQFQNAGTSIVFARLSGETGSTQTITIKDTTNQDSKTITFNKYGVITQVQ